MDTNLSRRSFLGLAGASALALSACGGSGSASRGASAEGILSVGSAYAPSSFDPQNCSSAFCLSANLNVMEGLYDIDFHDYSVSDGLCIGDPVWVDDNTCEISLREGATFSTGDPVTPDDVVQSFKRATAEGMMYVPFLTMIDSIDKKDASTLVVKVNIPKFSLIKERLAIIKVTPASLSEDEATSKPIGSGPWMYKEVSDTFVILEPNTHYNGKHPAKDKQIRIDSMVDTTARVTAQQEGTTLISESVPPESIEQLSNTGCTVDEIQGFGTRFIMFNVKKAPWNDKNARQAVMYALNTDQMIQNAFSGLAGKPTSYLPASFVNYHEAATLYSYDVEKAKQLAQGIAFPENIALRTTDNAQVVAMGTQAQQDIQDALGCKVTLTSDQSPATYAAIDQADDSWDILIAPGDPSCFGGDTDLLLNWWFGDNIWMQTRCAWNTSAEWKQIHDLMADALKKSGNEQQECWNKVFDIIADQCVLYPVLQVITPTASWSDRPSPTGVFVKDFVGIGTTGVMLEGVSTATS